MLRLNRGNYILGVGVILGVLLVSGSALAKDGSKLWLKTCSACHGVDGSGETPMGKRLQLPDFRKPEIQKSITDNMIQEAILKGLQRKKDGMLKIMPSYKHLPEADRLLLGKHFRTLELKPKAAPTQSSSAP